LKTVSCKENFNESKIFGMWGLLVIKVNDIIDDI